MPPRLACPVAQEWKSDTSRRMACVVLGVALALTGCFSSGRCVDGSCPVGQRCEPASNLCFQVESTEVCQAPCGRHQECVGGSCQPRYSGLAVRSPATGARVGASAPVGVELVLREGRTRADPSEVTVHSRSPGEPETRFSALRVDAGWYEATWTTPAREGEYELSASSAELELQSPIQRVTVDRTGPELTLAASAIPARDGGVGFSELDPILKAPVWRRDEVAALTLTSAAPDVAVDSVQIQVMQVDDGGTRSKPAPVSLEACPTAVAGFCRVARVDLSAPPLPGVRGTFEVTATARDLVGNVGSTATLLAVTRWKWTRELGGTIEASPAVGSDGTLYVGTVDAERTGRLVAVRPNGEVRWFVSDGAVRASPSVGVSNAAADYLFASFETAKGVKLAAFTAEGALRVDHRIAYLPLRSVQSLAVIAAADKPIGIRGVGSVSHTGERLMFIDPTPSGALGTAVALDDGLTESTGASTPMAVTADGQRLYRPELGGEVRVYEKGSRGWGLTSTLTTAAELRGQALAGSTYYSGFAGGLVGAEGSWSWGLPRPGGWIPIVDGSGRVLFGDDSGKLLRVARDAQVADREVSVAGIVKSASVLGDREIYAVSDTGQLSVWSPELQPVWSERFPPVIASPTLDCRRSPSGAKVSGPSTLYLATTDGRLLALVVDSHGVDVSAAWPKYQHDPRNTGNSGTRLSEFSCP